MELKYKKYNEMQNELQQAIRLLVEQGLFPFAMQLLWIYTRNCIFNYLERINIDFDSTQEAITLFMLNQDSIDMKKNIYFVYTSAIINEWDSNTSITKNHYDSFEKKCLMIKTIVTNE